MELKYIKELMAAMGRTGIKRLSIKKDDTELTLERGEPGGGRILETSFNIEESKPVTPQQRVEQTLSSVSEKTLPTDIPKQETTGTYITAPIVGTFYSTPAPDEPAFVKVGDKVDKNTVVCIVEAMKVLNEIKAGVSGTIAEAFVQQGEPVEFGTKLFRIIP